MTSVNPISTPVETSTTTFKGKKRALQALDKLAFEMPQQAVKEAAGKSEKYSQAVMEKINGMAYAATARCPEEVKERVMLETLQGHTDFVSGINEYLAKSAAKIGYKK